MLLHRDNAIAYHMFAGLRESLRDLNWLVLSGSLEFGGGRVGGSVSAHGGDPLVFAHPSADYGTLHGAERFSAAAWMMNPCEFGGEMFLGFFGPDASPVNGVRLLTKSADDGVTYPLWAELVNSGQAYRFPAPVPDMDPTGDTHPGVPHLLMLQLDRSGDLWQMQFSVDGGEFGSAGVVRAPRVPGPDIDLPSQVDDDESHFGVLLDGPGLDEFVFWLGGPGLRRAHAGRTRSLWDGFRSRMDAYTDRFGSERHDPPPRDRGRFGTPCRVNRPPEVDAPAELHMDVEAGSRPRQNEMEFFARDPDGGDVAWSVSAGAGEVGLHPHPHREDGVLVRYSPRCGSADVFTLRVESRCGLYEEFVVTVTIAGGEPCPPAATTTTAPPLEECP